MRSGALPARTKENHATHLLTVKENPALTHCYGVKNACPLTENLSYFHCVTGYPPDILHNIFEGIVPWNWVCASEFLSQRNISLSVNLTVPSHNFRINGLTNLIVLSHCLQPFPQKRRLEETHMKIGPSYDCCHSLLDTEYL